MILAQQIDQEISELRSVFEGHREEMLSLLDSAPQVPTTPARRSPIVPFNMTLPPSGGGGEGRQNVSLPANMEGGAAVEAETESDCCASASDRVKMDRKKEFEKRRQSVQNRRRKVMT